MIWLLFGLAVIGAVVGIVLAIRRNGGDWLSLGIPCSVVAVVMLIVLPSTAIKNSADFAELDVFYQVNSRNYEIAIDETASYLSEQEFAQALVEGSLEKIELAGYVSERISEWRDAVNAYNTHIAKMKYYDSNILLGSLYPDAVRNAKLLIIE